MDVGSYRQAPKIPLIVILDNIRSGLNVGSIFRTSDAFRIEKIYCVGISAVPPHREILKTALGATDAVDWEYRKEGDELARTLKRKGVKLIVLEQADSSVDIAHFSPETDQRYAVVFGNEVGGVSDEIFHIADQVLEIPQFGTKHSLNVAVCAGIVLWKFSAFWPKEKK